MSNVPSLKELEALGAHQELGVALIQKLSAEPSLELFKRAVSSLLLANHPDVVLQLLANIINQSPAAAAELSPFHYFALVLAGQDARAAMVLESLQQVPGSAQWAALCKAQSDREFRLVLAALPGHQARGCAASPHGQSEVVVSGGCPRCAHATRLRMSNILMSTFVPCSQCGLPFFVLPKQLKPIWPQPLTLREQRVLNAFGVV